MADFPMAKRERPKRGYPLVVLGFLWGQDAPGKWKRHMVRRSESTGEVHVDELFYADYGSNRKDLCMRCLSTNVTFTLAEHVWIVCHDCPRDAQGEPFRFRFVPG